MKQVAENTSVQCDTMFNTLTDLLAKEHPCRIKAVGILFRITTTGKLHMKFRFGVYNY